ncbi:MAG: hypothetical protein K1X89_22525, partial [Myxococcaceae bacterium]|nr:hypothetical protein [Myxococcaceae bacterium]
AGGGTAGGGSAGGGSAGGGSAGGGSAGGGSAGGGSGTAPSVFINQGATGTSSTTVTVDIVPTGSPTLMCLQAKDVGGAFVAPSSVSDPCFTAFATPAQATLPPGDGAKRVQVWLADATSTITPPGADDILLDTVAPTAPGSLKAAPSHRKVTLTFTAATDATSGVAGYQVGWSRKAGGPYTFEPTTAGTTASVTLENTLAWYLVVHALDAAGNVGPDSSEVAAAPDFPFDFQLSTPTTSDLRGVTFLANSSRYVLVGDHGALYLANAPLTGTPFVRRDAMTDRALEAVTTNGNSLVVAGAGGHLAISNDTGNFWSVLTNTQPNPRDLHDVAFAGAAAPPFAVSHYVAVGEGGTILHGSVDGAGPSPFAPAASPTGKTLRAVTSCQNGSGLCAGSSGIVIAVGDDATVVRSTDFGVTWSAVTMPTAFATAQFKDVIQVPGANLLYLTGKMPAGQSSLLVSVDGGQTWSDFFLPATSDIEGESMTVVGNDLWLLGTTGSNAPVLARFASGVRTDMNNFSTFNARLAAVFARGSAEVVGVGTGGELEYTLGPTAQTPVWQHAGSAGSALAVNDLTIPAGSSSTLWAVGSLGSITRSLNGGAAWSTQGSGVTSQTLNGVAAVDANQALATTFVVAVGAAGTITRSSNGGASWSLDPQSGTLTSNTLTAVSCRSATACVAVGVPQTVLTYDGVSWSAAFGATGGGYNDVDAYLSSTGVPRAVVVGNANAFRRFDGVAWVTGVFPTPGGTMVPYWGVAAKRDGLGSLGTVLAVGGSLASGAVVMKSVDHGATWASRALAGAPALSDVINVPGTGTWYVSGLGGYAARSDDDGETWNRLTTNSSVDLTRLATSTLANAAGSVWVGGQRRTLLSSSSGGR